MRSRPADRERTMCRMGTLLRMGHGASARDSENGHWLEASKAGRRIGGSRALILTDELEEAGYADGEDVTVMILRKGSDTSDKTISPMMEDDRMCIYEICPMMTGGEWPDCKTCPYADGTEGDERMEMNETTGCYECGKPGRVAGTVWDGKRYVPYCEDCMRRFADDQYVGMTVRHDDEDEYQSRLCTKYGPRKLIAFSDHSGEMMVFSVPDNGDERMTARSDRRQVRIQISIDTRMLIGRE